MNEFIMICWYFAGHNGQKKYCDRDAILDGPRSDTGDRLRLCSWYMEFRYTCNIKFTPTI